MNAIDFPDILKELHDDTKLCFGRHNFETYGAALEWWLTEDYDIREAEAGSAGISILSTDIAWLISLFGPDAIVDERIKSLKKTLAAKKAVLAMPVSRRRPRRPKKQ